MFCIMFIIIKSPLFIVRFLFLFIISSLFLHETMINGGSNYLVGTCHSLMYFFDQQEGFFLIFYGDSFLI